MSISEFVQIFLSICGGVSIVGGAAAVIFKWITPDEERLFRLRCQERTLEYCAEKMNVSISTAKRLSRRVNNKIIKVC